MKKFRVFDKQEDSYSKEKFMISHDGIMYNIYSCIDEYGNESEGFFKVDQDRYIVEYETGITHTFNRLAKLAKIASKSIDKLGDCFNKPNNRKYRKKKLIEYLRRR